MQKRILNAVLLGFLILGVAFTARNNGDLKMQPAPSCPSQTTVSSSQNIVFGVSEYTSYSSVSQAQQVLPLAWKMIFLNLCEEKMDSLSGTTTATVLITQAELTIDLDCQTHCSAGGNSCVYSLGNPYNYWSSNINVEGLCIVTLTSSAQCSCSAVSMQIGPAVTLPEEPPIIPEIDISDMIIEWFKELW